MKNLKNTLLKGLLIMTFFSGISVGLTSTGVNIINEAHAAVSYKQVNQYLVANGYQVITLNPVGGNSENWIAHTVKNNVHYWTTVIVQGSNIIGVLDVIF